MRIFKYILIFVLFIGGVITFARADQSLEVLGSNDLAKDQVDFSGDMAVSPDPDSGSGFVEYNPFSDRLGIESASGLMSVAPIGPSDDGSLKSLLLSFIGTYDPIVLEHEYTSGNGYTSVLREVQIDYPWLAACALLIVVMFCFFRTLGYILGGFVNE